MGDPAGIGPEILLKSLKRSNLKKYGRFVVLGDYEVLKKTHERVFKRFPFPSFTRLFSSQVNHRRDLLNHIKYPLIVDFKNIEKKKPEWGRPLKEYGRASGDYVQTAVDWAGKKIIDGVVTCPINKISFHLGGWGKKYVGHTEMMTHLSGSSRSALMMVKGSFRVVHLTSHIPFKRIGGYIKKKKLVDLIELADKELGDFGIHKPRIAVAALNPHGGENGRLGVEEKMEISPAVKECRNQLIDVTGPIPGDIIWPRLMAKEFDVGIALYHDQGQIPIKMLGFDFNNPKKVRVSGVNVTLGLPFVRTSVDHGTAYDIAGKGVASETSLNEAIRMCSNLIMKRNCAR